ncbi:MAG: hypothetical protein FJ167_13610, partial [Gammaproteobacteria bacterium]|nr:hypothetical protein [Gammaproteobacteria bacterium]
GTTDTLINFGSGPNARVLSLGSTATSILIGGEFTTFDGIARNRVAQLLGGDILVGQNLSGLVQFSTATYTADEDAGSVGILVKRTSGLQGAVTFSFRTTDPTVTFLANQVSFSAAHGLAPGRQVRFYSGGGTLPAEITSGAAYFVRTVISSKVVDLSDTLNGSLKAVSSGSGTCILPSFAPLPQFSVTSVDAGLNTITLTPNPPVHLANGDTVVFDTANIPGVAAGTVYTVASYNSGTRTFGITLGVTPVDITSSTLGGAVNVLRGFSFAPGENLKTITLTLTNEATLNGNHNVPLTLANVTGGTAALGSPASATLTIQDNDSVLGFDFDNYSVSESTLTASLSVSRLGSTAGSASVNYATVAETGAGKATEGVDYTPTSGTLTFGI